MTSSRSDELKKVKEYLNSKIYFYSTRDPSTGFLSNFYWSEMYINGKQYYHVEGYYQASKFFGDNEYASESIRLEPSPITCKAMSKEYEMTPERESEWEQGLKLQRMKEAVLVKFSSNTELKNLLLSTGNKELIEKSLSDYYWGCGKDETGQNMLGKVLMEVRDILRGMHFNNA